MRSFDEDLLPFQEVEGGLPPGCPGRGPVTGVASPCLGGANPGREEPRPLARLLRELLQAPRVELSARTLGDDTGVRELPEELHSTSQSVTELDIQGSFFAALPAWIGSFARLETLHLAGCGDASQCHLYNRALASLPDALGDLSALKALRLAKLVALEELPQSVGRLAALRRLEVDSCGLTTLPTGSVLAGLTQLGFLSLGDCWRLTHLGEGLAELQSLQTLVLRDLLDLVQLPAATGRLTALRTLSVSGCCEVTELPPSFGDLTALQSLVLGECYIQDLLCLQSLTALHTLRVSVHSDAFVPDGEEEEDEAGDTEDEEDEAEAEQGRRGHSISSGPVGQREHPEQLASRPVCLFFKTLAFALPCLQMLQTLDVRRVSARDGRDTELRAEEV